ncbi:MAG: tetratricopeptide repeat protein [Deltaproteobacteria bacterium]|nr:tetratricopeptide repeat protein [Deltaproteobacteria bacterium]
MTSRKTDPVHLIGASILYALLAVFLFLSAYQLQHWDSDIFWALKSGERIFTHLTVPKTDPFSYTFGNAEWIDFTWGFQAISYFFYEYMGGWTGLFVLQLLVTGATFVFVFLNIRLKAPRLKRLAPALLFLVYAASHSRLFIRPHLFEYFFVSLYLYLLSLHESTDRARYLYALFPLQALWINIHSSSILGIFIVGAYALGSAIDGPLTLILSPEGRGRGHFQIIPLSPPGRGKGEGDSTALSRGGFQSLPSLPHLWGRVRPGWRLVIIAALLPVASLLNPYGYKLLIWPFIHQGSANTDALMHIGEWGRTGFKELFFFLYPSTAAGFAFKALFFSSALAVFFNLRGLKTRDAFMLGAALYMAVTHMRWVALFGFFVAPIIASNIASYAGRKNSAVSGAKAAFTAVALLTAFVLAYGYTRPAELDNMGLGLKNAVFPQGTVAFMKKEGLKDNIYNEYVFGGYLIYNHPEAKVFIDGRTPTVFSPYFFWKSRLPELDVSAWRKIEKEYGLLAALVDIDGRLCKKVFMEKDWVAVSFDDVSVLYLKRTDANKDIISRWGLEGVSLCVEPDEATTLPKDEKGLLRLREYLKRVLSPDGYGAGFARPHLMLALTNRALEKREYLIESAEELKAALRISPAHYLYYDLGLVLSKLGRNEDAVSAFKSALKRKPRYRDAYRELGYGYYNMKDYKNAVCYLEKYARAADDATEALAYQTLGKACFQLSRYDCAIEYLERAAFKTDDGKFAADIYFHLGGSFFEKAVYSEGARYYQLSVDAEPEYIKVLAAIAESYKTGNRHEAHKALTSIISHKPTGKATK